MTTRAIRTEAEREGVIRLIKSRELPMTVNVTKGAPRSIEQNKLQRKWLGELEDQGDMSSEEYRGYCKLRFGVGILKRDNPIFAAKYDAIIKPHSYEDKMSMMMEPFSFPITSVMTTKQKAEYLDAVYRHFTEKGIQLTRPEQ